MWYRQIFTSYNHILLIPELISVSIPYPPKMELEIIPWPVYLLFLFLTILTLLLNLSKPSKKRSKLPPGPPKLPIIGNLHQLASNSSLPHHRLAELAKVHGPIMHLQLGSIPTIIISSADVAREVLRAYDAATCSRPGVLMAEHVFYGRNDIAFAPYGEYWRQVRKIASLELFTARRVRSFRGVRAEEAAELTRSMAWEQGEVVNLSHKLFCLYFEIFSRSAFNRKGKEQEEFKALVGDISKVASGFSICDLYPSIKILSSITGMRRKLEHLVRRSDVILNPIISDHISKKKQGKRDDHEDLVDVLLTHLRDEPSSQPSQFSFTINSIKAIVLELFAAGSETSATTVEWAMAELLKNPKAMEKAQDEVRRLLKLHGDETVDEAGLDELVYLKQVVKETFRLHPPVPLLIPRESMEQCQVYGHEIPAKTRVLVNVWAIGRDPKYWEVPEQFRPERFENSLVDFKGNHFELIPFGAGRRMCPGLGLGTVNVEHALATLLYHFNWRLPDGIRFEELNMEERFGIVARKKHDLLVIPTLYSHSPLKL